MRLQLEDDSEVDDYNQLLRLAEKYGIEVEAEDYAFVEGDEGDGDS